MPWARMFGVKRESPVWEFPGSPTWREIVTLAAVAGDFDFLRELFRSDSANVAHKDVKLALIDQLLIDR